VRAPLGFFNGAECDAGVAGAIPFSGATPTQVSTLSLELTRYECTAAAAPPLRASAISVEGHAELRVELTSGASQLTKNRCLELRVRTLDARGRSIFVPAASAIAITVDGGAVGTSSLCDDSDAGVAITVQSGGSTALFYLRTPLGSPDGGAFVQVRATPAPGVLADESLTSLPAACLPTGTTCRTTPGACCNACSIGTDTCT
jgi:hypothetical protein